MNKNKLLILIGMIMGILAFFTFNSKNESPPKKRGKTKEIKVLKDEKVLNLDLESYIIGVVAGEMPASFNEEALKAQAVAARSYALKNNDENKILKADTSSQVYINESEMKQKWNNEYDYYYNKIKKAVLETKGEVLTSNNKIITAYYFALSNGKTQNGKYVFKEENYLQGEDSIHDNETIKNFKTDYTFTVESFKEKLGLSCEKITIDYIHYNESEYVSDISVCSKSFTGNAFRHALGLRSPSFKISVNENVYITTYGYGHGVGLSQYGANGYASDGLNYKEILKHYYKNTEITKIDV